MKSTIYNMLLILDQILTLYLCNNTQVIQIKYNKRYNCNAPNPGNLTGVDAQPYTQPK